jgi:hypothetical protein
MGFCILLFSIMAQLCGDYLTEKHGDRYHRSDFQGNIFITEVETYDPKLVSLGNALQHSATFFILTGGIIMTLGSGINISSRRELNNLIDS